MGDQFIPRDWRRDWLNQYTVQAAPEAVDSNTEPAENVSSKNVGWSAHDTLGSAKQSQGVDSTFQTDVLDTSVAVAPASSSGVRIFGGKDQQGMPVYGEVDIAPFYWIKEFSTDSLVSYQAESIDKQQKESATKPSDNRLTPLQSLFSVTRRLVYPPFRRVVRFFGQMTNRLLLRPLTRLLRPIGDAATALAIATVALVGRVVTPAWRPIQKAVNGLAAFAQSAYDALREPVTNGIKAIGRGTKKVLDTLILDAPRAARTGLLNVLQRFSDWLRR